MIDSLTCDNGESRIKNKKDKNKFIYHYYVFAISHWINDHLIVSLCYSKATSKLVACEDI